MRLEDEKNIEQLRAKAVVLASENERMSKKLVELLKENLALKGMTAVQLEQALGLLDKELNRAKSEPAGTPSSERRGAAPKNERKEQRGHGPRAQPNLEIVTQLHDLDEADKVCPRAACNSRSGKDRTTRPRRSTSSSAAS